MSCNFPGCTHSQIFRGGGGGGLEKAPVHVSACSVIMLLYSGFIVSWIFSSKVVKSGPTLIAKAFNLDTETLHSLSIVFITVIILNTQTVWSQIRLFVIEHSDHG